MKESALEWFLTEFKKQVWFEKDSELDIWINELIPKAKKMEIKQIINAYENLDYDDGNEYYNATYKQ
jgi:hypothetical protein